MEFLDIISHIYLGILKIPINKILWNHNRDVQFHSIPGYVHLISYKSIEMKNFQNKSELTRYLIKKRVRQSPELYVEESAFDSLKGMILAGMPESTIVNIVEDYAALNKQGNSDNEIFKMIENNRMGSGKMPNPLTLKSYITYRLKLIHNQGINISDEFVSNAIKICCEYYGCDLKSKTLSKNDNRN